MVLCPSLYITYVFNLIYKKANIYVIFMLLYTSID